MTMGQWNTFIQKNKRFAVILPLALALMAALLFHYSKGDLEVAPSQEPNTSIPIEESELDSNKLSYYERYQKDSVQMSQPDGGLYSKSLGEKELSENEAAFHEKLKDYYQDSRLPPQNPYALKTQQTIPDVVEVQEEESEPIRFYSRPKMVATNETSMPISNTIKAQVIGRQEVSEKDNWVKLRLLEALPINGKELPKHSILMGTASFDAQRIYISVSTIRLDQNIISVAMEAYDSFGSRGLAVTGGTGAQIEAEMTEATADEVLNDPTLQKVPGIRASKRLFQKMPKAKLDNDPILLLIESL